MKIEIIATGDGSHSLFRADLNETYHSMHGALAESQHVYIEMGLKRVLEKKLPIKILEVGFGTGLNALLTYRFAFEQKMNIQYHTLEPYPLSKEVVAQLNYPSLLNMDRTVFERMHFSDPELEVFISEELQFKKYHQKLEQFVPQQTYTLIYFDAFAPNKQSEMWRKEQFVKLFTLLETGGVLTTYCAQGQFKRTLKEAGFEVHEVPGPPKKRQMTIAIKP